MDKKYYCKLKKILSLLLIFGYTTLAACQTNRLSKTELDLLRNDNIKTKQAQAMRKDINLAIQNLPRHYRPELSKTLPEKAVIDQIYEGLTTLRNNRISLQEAEKIEPNKDFTTWTIKLRDDLYWSDGSKLTALDYKRSWLKYLTMYAKPDSRSALKAESYRAWIIDKAEQYSKGEVNADEVGLTVKGNELVVRLNRSFANFPAWLSQSFFYPSKKDKSGQALYNGAYVPDKLSTAAIQLKLNEKHWDAVNVWLKKINITVIKDEVQAYEAYHNGNIDFIGEPFYPICKDRRQVASRSAESLSFPLARLGYIKLLNFEHKLFATAEKRQALYELLDAPFQANVLLQDGSKAWLDTNTPSQSRREELAKVLKSGLSAQDLTSLTEENTVGLGGPALLEYRILVASSKDWLNALKVRFLLQRVLEDKEQADFAYCVDLAPDGEIADLLALWSLTGEIKLTKDKEQLIWADNDKKRELKANLQAVWQNLPSTSGILPLTTRNALVMVRPDLIGVNVDKTGKLLLSHLQWRF